MSKITAIENAICNLGPGEFQKFCDTFLSKKEQYGAIHGLGMKTGTMKTTIGNPDTYFLRGDKYVFVAYTAQDKQIYQKIKEDIEKCMDSEKTGIQLSDIDEIICCHTSSNLLAGDDQKLHKICSDKGIKLTIFGVDEIAQQVYSRYPILASDFLGIHIDTNQIMSDTEFVKLYNSSETAAPLDTIFQHRKKELEELIEAINSNSAVIVHGTAGVGKTRIVLEATRKYAMENHYNLLCVKSNNQELYNDLVSYVENPGKYLFFVDDADGLSGLNLVLDYITKEDKGYIIKIIMTVRNYAKDIVIDTAQKLTNPYLFELQGFSDDEIKEFLNVNLEIKNKMFVDAIIKISEGNPRIAYMAGRVAVTSQSIYSLKDATHVYEMYYSSIINSKLESDYKLCLTAGILALVRAVIMDKTDALDFIFQSGYLSKDEFISCIYRLSAMEVAEIHLDKIASLSDQCFANYMLYYVFFDKKSIPLSEIIKVGFVNFREGIIRSLNTLLNIFEKEEVYDYIKNEVLIVWNKFRIENNGYFEDFARVFHAFNPEEAFAIVYDKINKIPQEQYDGESIDFNKGTIRSGEDILGFLNGYNHTKNLFTVIELLIEYVKKSKDNALIGYSWLENYYGLRNESYIYEFKDEIIIADKLSEFISENEFVQKFILAYAAYGIGYEYKYIECDRGYSIKMYHMKPINASKIMEYRKKCWQIIMRFLNVKGYKNELIDIMKKYAKTNRCIDDASILSEEKEYVERIVYQLDCSDLTKAIIFKELYDGWDKHDISYKYNSSIFETDEWKVYEIIEDEKYCGDIDFVEYKNQIDQRIIKFADELKTEDDICKFIKITSMIIKENITNSNYSHIEHFTKIVQRVSEKKELAWVCFRAVLKYGYNIKFEIGCLLPNVFVVNSPSEVWDLLNQYYNENNRNWIIRFFQCIPHECINQELYDMMLSYFAQEYTKKNNTEWYSRINLRFLDKYKVIDKDVYVTVSKIIYENREYNKYICNEYFSLLFNENVYLPDEILNLFESNCKLLKNIYFYTIKNDWMADYNKTFLIRFLSIDDSWLDAYADMFYSKLKDNCCSKYDYTTYNALWKTQNYMHYFDKIFDRVMENMENVNVFIFAHEFKKILASDKKDETILYRQEIWVERIIEKYTANNQVLWLFKAISETESSLKEKTIKKFLECNDDFEMFDKICLEADHWGGSEEEIILEYKNRIEFLNSLLPVLTGIKFIKHANKIKKQIEFWKRQIKQEEQENIYRKLYY